MANFGAVFRWDLCGASTMVKCDSIPMMPSAQRSAPCLLASLNSDQHVAVWFRSEHLSFPLQSHDGSTIRWIDPGYITIHHVLENPVYAGAYAYGKSRCEVTLDASERAKGEIRKLPQSQWSGVVPHHHEGYIDWHTYEANRARMAAETPARAPTTGWRRREGTALLQGLAVCGQCGRKLRTHYTGRTASAAITAPARPSQTVAASIALASAQRKSMR